MPEILASEPSESHDSILLSNTLRIPLLLYCSISYIPTHTLPTQDYHNLLNVPLTVDNPFWNPH